MQIFEVIPLTEFPFMETREVIKGEIVSDLLNENSKERVFLVVDHDEKRIWTYNGPKSSLKTQVYGGILAGMLRQQLKLFYRTYPLNIYTEDDDKFKEILEKPIGGGRAKPIEKSSFSTPIEDRVILDISLRNFKANKAIEYINQFPPPMNMIRRFIIVGGIIYTEEEIIEAFVKEKKTTIKPVKLGRLNDGFTFFKDHNYSTRLIINDRKIQGLELYINEKDRSPPLELEIPIIHEDKFNKPGSIKKLIKAFQIPVQIPENNNKIHKNDSTNKS